MFGVTNYKKKYKNSAGYINLELQDMRKYYDEVLKPQVDAAFAEIMDRNELTETETEAFDLDWLLEQGENDGR